MGSVMGIGQYWDISTVSVIGISIVLLTDYALMTSYILGTWYLWVKHLSAKRLGMHSTSRMLRHRRQQLFWRKLQHLCASLLFKKAEIACIFRHLWWTCAAYSLMNQSDDCVVSCPFSVAACERLGQVNKEVEPRYMLQSRYLTECANYYIYSKLYIYYILMCKY